MIGLVIVTHGRLAEEFILAMEHVVGPQTGVRAITRMGGNIDLIKDLIAAGFPVSRASCC